MRIALGRRHLTIAIQSVEPRSDAIDLPMAINASDAELARLNAMRTAAFDRTRWETNAIMFGAARLYTY